MSDEIIITVVEEGVKEVEVADGSRWGSIGGDIDDQTDLKNLLNTKADTEDLGEMSFVDDAPSDHNEYVRKDGAWSEPSGGGGTWGSITGTLSNQTDLQSALDAKANASDVATALSAKANNSILGDAFSTSVAYAVGDYCIYEGALYRFTSAHSAGAWNSSHVTQVVAMNELAALSAQVASRQKFEVTGTASAGSSVTITDSRINSEHWKVPKNGIWFSDSSKVTTRVHWITNVSNHTLTLEATFTGATDVKVDLDWYQ